MTVFAIVQCGASVRAEIVDKRATCPFLASAIAAGALPVRNEATNPLAGIHDVKELGNSGGGDLGDLLVLFAAGNHAYMRGRGGCLDEDVPAGLFSLDLPGSQGSHPGHSGILQGDPEKLGSGRLSQGEFARLARRAQDGLIKRSDVGRFIAENLTTDPKAKVVGWRVTALLVRDLGDFLMSVGPAVAQRPIGFQEGSDRAHRDLARKLTRILGENNLFGSAGEFGLLFAFLANRPDAKRVDGEPAVAVADLRAMFIDKQLPDGWENWRKTRRDWVTATSALAVSAGREYVAIKADLRSLRSPYPRGLRRVAERLRRAAERRHHD